MSRPPVSRRALLRSGGLAGLVGAGTLAGCDLDPGPSSGPSATSATDPDLRIVEAGRAELSGLIVRLRGTRGAAALVACHRAQLAALQGTPPPRSRRARPLTAAQTVARERRAAERFTGWAQTSQNGDLARVLACIAAGIRMQAPLRGTT